MAYFDMFRYPLRREEVAGFLPQLSGTRQLTEALDMLIEDGYLFELDGFLLLHNNPALVERRKAGNTRAAHLLKIARRVGRLLYRFPFVRGVGISGSLSKQFADEDADIDFFIITAPNRLWVARTMMHLLKKMSFLLGKQHWFCMNYYISSDALTINEKNIFTATEVVTLIPVCGAEYFQQFFQANKWASDFYPNHPFNLPEKKIIERNGALKYVVEKILSGSWGSHLDNYWMQLTSKRWLHKQLRNDTNSKGEPMGLKVSKQFARPAPELFQQNILDRYSRKLIEIKTLCNRKDPVLQLVSFS